MPKPSDTKQRILDVARDLFTTQGVQRTSLQDIADRLGITKPALYYHFPSRDDLVRSIVQPMLEDGEQFLLDQEARGDAPVRELIEGFFDFNYRHRADVVMLLAEMPTLADLGLIDRVLGWRTRLTELICGPSPTVAQQARAILALGGLQDVCMQFPDVPVGELKAAAVEGALDALGR
ncbi:TetR/AcrR family transcriptional regulator [Amycolatopsis vancoresmycina]|uniref:TetR family transcriptional regulator n=1 Tax=Amycolatopsis vancoresmycina DSM 44592 TaxID=1292037 RepID=R1IB13_9PSEU|nr:TetR/AcrR family transcriptional regulator [Amycolatopsis vancoresmycina]EOD67584.1 TetR family transcriptional regulator [Amycolatopsis vancoresmycina DSM 44592]